MRAKCEVTGAFEGAAIPGAKLSGEAEKFAFDLFTPSPTHELLITVTQEGGIASLAISLRKLQNDWDLFLETRLASLVLSLSFDGAYEGRTLDSISILCHPSQ
jgi:hypothetical protein